MKMKKATLKDIRRQIKRVQDADGAHSEHDAQGEWKRPGKRQQNRINSLNRAAEKGGFVL